MDAEGLPARLAGRLARGRQWATARMLDTFEIKVPLEGDDGWTTDLDGNDVRVYDESLTFTTPGRVKQVSAQSVIDADVGARTAATAVRVLNIPWDSPQIPPGAEAHALSIDATSDPTLAGAVLILGALAPGSQTTARRIQVKEVQT